MSRHTSSTTPVWLPARPRSRAARESNAADPGLEDRVMSNEAENTLQRALAYARHGWPVFPCRPGSKEPATRHGFHDATTDQGRIRSWWRRQPAANVAIATGQPGPDVLDVDQHGEAGSGFAAFSRLKHEGLLEGASAIVATPGGGLHAYFTGSDQASGRLPRQHLDFRAQGGYVLAPPSQVDGRPYRLITHHAQSGGLDWAAVTTLLEPRADPARPAQDRGTRRPQPPGRMGRAPPGRQSQRGPVLGRLPRRRSRPARRPGRPRRRGSGNRPRQPRDRPDHQLRPRGGQRPFEHQTEPEGTP